MKYCRMDGDIVAEVFDYDPFEWLPGSPILATCVSCPDNTKQGYVYKDGVFVDPATTPYEPTPEERLVTVESENNLLKSQLQAQTDRSDFVEECIAEMATLVYV